MSAIRSVLDKVEVLLTTEPARLIGYGAAVVIVIVAQVLGHFRPGLLPEVSFDEAAGAAFLAISLLVVVVESIRHYVYAPQTYIEDLSDENHQGHLEAHAEEEFRRTLDAIAERQAAKAKPRQNIVSRRAPGDNGDTKN